jgi:TIR domain
VACEVFISHAGGDAILAARVCEAIEAKGIGCWLASRDILPGRDYPAALADALNACRAMVLLLSQQANSSPHVVREVERAVSRGILIIPLRIEDVELEPALEYLLSSVQWLEATTPDRDRPIALAIDTLHNYLATPSVPAPPPQIDDSGHPGPLMSTHRPSASPTGLWGRSFGPMGGAGIALGVVAILVLSWTLHDERTWRHASSADPSVHEGAQANPSPVPNVLTNVALGGTSSATDALSSAGGHRALELDASAGAPAAGKGGAGNQPPPGKQCCTASGVGKYCPRLHCEDCGLIPCQ